jgi:urease accessory protein UreF
MIREATVLQTEKATFKGELHNFLEQLGSSEDKYSFAAGFPDLRSILSAKALREFLLNYKADLLLPLELPSIYSAYKHASRNECREFVALDELLANEPRFKPFSGFSLVVGQHHLKRLRPLRDSRVVQRYLHAIEGGQAHGWHTLVYGLTLALYSVPARQGLIAYGQQTVSSFIDSASRRFSFSHQEQEILWTDMIASLPGDVDKLISPVGVVVR